MCRGDLLWGNIFSDKGKRRRPHNILTQAKIINEYKCDKKKVSGSGGRDWEWVAILHLHFIWKRTSVGKKQFF